MEVGVVKSTTQRKSRGEHRTKRGSTEAMKTSIIKILVAAILLPIALTDCKQTNTQTHSTE